MPILEIHLIANRHSDADVSALLKDASNLYVEILYPDMDPRPIERVRTFATFHSEPDWATGGILGEDGGESAPYFTCLALAGRPSDQLQHLLLGMTDLIVHHLGVRKAGVRGRVIPVEPALWCIGGTVATQARKIEVDQRRIAN